MANKILDIPFLSRSSDSDFCCRDGEIDSFEGCTITDDSFPAASSGDSSSENSGLFRYQKNFIPEIPPVPEISFVLKRAHLSGWHVSPDAYPSKTLSSASSPTEDSGNAAREVLSEFNNDAARSNLFTSPFFAIAAWRLANRMLVSPSSPVFLIPNSSSPLVVVSSSPDSVVTEFKVIASLGKLLWKISLPESLREWAGKIHSLEIMVSAPLPLYDPDKAFIYERRISCDSFSQFLDSSMQKSAETAVCDETFGDAWKPVPVSSADYQEIVSRHSFFTVASLSFEKILTADSFSEVESNHGNLHDVYRSVPYLPSYAMLSLKKSRGAVAYRDKKILWGLEMQSPDFVSFDRATAVRADDTSARWIFHPDPACREYQWRDSSGILRKVPLRPHPYLYGAYYWAGLSAALPAALPADNVVARNEKFETGKIWFSHTSEPPVFNDAGLQDLHCGEIIAVCRAFRSSGLVATVSPTLYIFTGLGLFLFKESASGIFTDAGLIAGYILNSPESLQILPQGIRFTTVAGECVMVSGTSVKAFSTSSSASSSPEKVILRLTGNQFRFISRPLKLSSAGDFKCVKRVFLRGYFEPSEISVTVSGSRDMRSWIVIGRRSGGATVVMNKFRCRFFRIEVEGSSSGSLHGLTLLQY